MKKLNIPNPFKNGGPSLAEMRMEWLQERLRARKRLEDVEILFIPWIAACRMGFEDMKLELEKFVCEAACDCLGVGAKVHFFPHRKSFIVKSEKTQCVFIEIADKTRKIFI